MCEHKNHFYEFVSPTRHIYHCMDSRVWVPVCVCGPRWCVLNASPIINCHHIFIYMCKDVNNIIRCGGWWWSTISDSDFRMSHAPSRTFVCFYIFFSSFFSWYPHVFVYASDFKWNLTVGDAKFCAIRERDFIISCRSYSPYRHSPNFQCFVSRN